MDRRQPRLQEAQADGGDHAVAVYRGSGTELGERIFYRSAPNAGLVTHHEIRSRAGSLANLNTLGLRVAIHYLYVAGRETQRQLGGIKVGRVADVDCDRDLLSGVNWLGRALQPDGCAIGGAI